MNGPGSLFVGPNDNPDKYRLKRQVGSGGEATLWEAEINVSGTWEPVAVKVLRVDRSADLDGWVLRWGEQAEVLRFIRHPGVVGVREHFLGGSMHLAGEAPPAQASLYLVMNWVAGSTFRDWSATRRPGSDTELLNYLAQIGDVLDWLHSGQATPSGRPVVHADVTPNNVILSPSGQAVLIDFGLARLTGGIGNVIEGTGGYLAPEVKAAGAYSPASDRYAFGALAYFLLTGTSPPLSLDLIRHGLNQLHADRNENVPLDELMTIFDPVPTVRPRCGDWIRQFGHGEQTLVESGGFRPVAPAALITAPPPPPPPPPSSQPLAPAASSPNGSPRTEAVRERVRRRRMAIAFSMAAALMLGAVVVIAMNRDGGKGTGSTSVPTTVATRDTRGDSDPPSTALGPCYSSRQSCAGQDLHGLTLPDGTDLHGIDFSQANLSNAHLVGANLDGATFFGANLTGAQLQGAKLRNTNMQAADLHGADMSNVDLTDAYFLDITVSGLPTLTGAILPDGAPALPAPKVDKDPNVARAQQELNDLGITKAVSTDGLLGPDTGRALRAFQYAYGLEPTGLVDQLTQGMLPFRSGLLPLIGSWTSSSGETVIISPDIVITATDSLACSPQFFIESVDAGVVTFGLVPSDCHPESTLTVTTDASNPQVIQISDMFNDGSYSSLTGRYTRVPEAWKPLAADVVQSALGDLTLNATSDPAKLHGAMSSASFCNAVFEAEGRDTSGAGSWGIAVHAGIDADGLVGRGLVYQNALVDGFADMVYPEPTPKHFYLSPTDTGWHRLKIVVTERYFAEWVDGKFIVEGKLTAPCNSASNHFVIRANSPGSVEVRNIRISDISFTMSVGE